LGDISYYVNTQRAVNRKVVCALARPPAYAVSTVIQESGFNVWWRHLASPSPFASILEHDYQPTKATIIAAVKELVE
jgi:hypothetical protein